ncbi:MAG: SAM-dependent chlorinase/fluorinase [Gammaproteobacteria bacterium]
MIVLFTDYGLQGPYLGEVEAVLWRYAPNERVINLFADVPRQDPRAGACLLAAYAPGFPRNTIFFCVVDPGVGSGADKPVTIRMGDHRFVGPHNGLFDLVTRRGEAVECWEITYQPSNLSNTFHGRDLYAPVCAMLANQQPVPGRKMDWRERYGWPDDLYEVIYIDGFGNAMTGVLAGRISSDAVITVAGRELRHADTFANVKKGEAFWYENSAGLLEIAVNQGNAAESLGLKIGSAVTVVG